jgi:hypothetical protein
MAVCLASAEARRHPSYALRHSVTGTIPNAAFPETPAAIDPGPGPLRIPNAALEPSLNGGPFPNMGRAFGRTASGELAPITIAAKLRMVREAKGRPPQTRDCKSSHGRERNPGLLSAPPWLRRVVCSIALITLPGRHSGGLRNRPTKARRDTVWVVAAGTGINMVLALIAALSLHLVGYDTVGQRVGENLKNALIINVILAVFNLLPLPDAGRWAP